MKAVSQGLSRVGAELGDLGDRLEWKEVTRANRSQGLTSQNTKVPKDDS